MYAQIGIHWNRHNYQTATNDVANEDIRHESRCRIGAKCLHNVSVGADEDGELGEAEEAASSGRQYLDVGKVKQRTQ